MYAPGRTRVLALAILASLAGWIGCGSGSSVNGQGPGLGDNSKNALLQGQYAFAMSGQDSNGAFFAVGSFVADGQGHIGGNEDVNSSATSTHGTPAHFAGTYSVGADGRGNAVVGIQPGCPNWQFTMVSQAHALLTCLNTNITASGTIDRQDPTAFITAALKGNYVFGLSGVGVAGALAVSAGNWTMDGAGNISSGQMDVNDLGLAAALPDIGLTGTYSVSNTGRGTATLSSTYINVPQNFVFYVVNATDIKFMENEPNSSTPALAGEVLSQASNLTASSFTGNYVFTLGGADANSNVLAMGGLLSPDGNGNIASGVLDVNYGGNLSLGASVSGSYVVNATGRGSGTITSSLSFPFAFYRAANGTLELVNLGESPGSVSFVVSGMAKGQAGPFSNSSLTGNYAVNFSGTNFSSGGEEDISGQLTGDGAGNLGGTIDINNSGSIFQGVPLSASSYSIGATGRGTATINTATGTFGMQTYQIDANTLLFLDTDSARVTVGLGEKQSF